MGCGYGAHCLVCGFINSRWIFMTMCLRGQFLPGVFFFFEKSLDWMLALFFSFVL